MNFNSHPICNKHEEHFGTGITKINLEKLSDEVLIQNIRDTNNPLYFKILHDRYAKKIYNKCFSFSKDADEAKDLTQDVFLKLYVKLNSFKGNSKFSTWLYSFTYNFCANYVTRDKETKIKKHTSSTLYSKKEILALEDIEELDFSELKSAKLDKAMALITFEDKEILLLKYQDDISIKELANLYKISESAVKMRLKRARLKITEFYKKV